jgi:hypothetical protein
VDWPSNQHHIRQNKLWHRKIQVHENQIKIFSYGITLFGHSSSTNVNLTSNVVDWTSTVVGLTSTMVGWTFAAIDWASMTLLDWLQGEQQQGKQALSWELTLICLATRGKQTKRTSGNKFTNHALGLFDFFGDRH